MKLNELVEKGFLKKKKVRREEILNSLKLAKKFLRRAKGNFKINFWDVAFLLAYNSLFHSARALLFKHGYKERSHWAMVLALKNIYRHDERITRFLEIIDSYRISRHAIQYSGEFCSKIDAEEAIKDAEVFLKIVKKTLGEER